MLKAVTITARRRIYWVLFAFACLGLAASAFLALPVFTGKADTSFLQASGGLPQVAFLGASLPSPSLAAAGVLLSALFSALCLGYVLYSFRKTVSSEIFFFAFWVLSLAIESGRLAVFSLASGGAPTRLVLAATRLVLAGRFCGVLSIFAAGLYAAGFRNEKLGSVLLFVVVIGGTLAWAVPLNTGVYEATLLVRPGYAKLLELLALLAGLATAANFVYAVNSTGERSYRAVALGAAALLLGQRLLVTQVAPLALALGFALLLAGAWLFVSRLHAYYLWQ